jgi:hypothetical protein
VSGARRPISVAGSTAWGVCHGEAPWWNKSPRPAE